MKRTLARVACLVILATGTVGLADNPAHALPPTAAGDGFITNTCKGAVRAIIPVRVNRKKVAQTVVYFSPAGKGTYCAQVRVTDRSRQRMSIVISKPRSVATDTYPWLRRSTLGVGLRRSGQGCVNLRWSVGPNTDSARFCDGDSWYANKTA